MPYRIKKKGYRKKRNKVKGLATIARMMPRALQAQRFQNASTKTFYLKDAGTLTTDLNGVIEQVWSVQDIYSVPQFAVIGNLYDQFKCLAMKIRLYPANVGIEPDPSALPVGNNGLIRGNAGVWSEQRPGATTAFPSSITEMINYGSSRLINPRRPYQRAIYRAKGFPTWGGIESTATNDQWRGVINLLQVDASAAAAGGISPVLWYWSRTFKIVYRGRRST